MTNADESEYRAENPNFEAQLTEEQLNRAVALSQVNDGIDRASTAAEVAKFREEYQQLNTDLGEQITRALEKRSDDNDLNVTQLVEKLDEISGTFEKVSCGRELAADAQVLESMSKFGFVRAQALQEANAGKVLNVKSFAKKLLAIVCPTPTEERDPDESYEQPGEGLLRRWGKFGMAHDAKIFQTVPALCTLRPFMFEDEAVVRPKKERVKYEREKNEAVKLQALSAESAKQDDLTRQLDNVYRSLKQQLKRRNCDRIGYYEFCLHPTDFSRTVENVFYISFLVKEAKVKIIRPDGGLPQIARVSDGEKKDLHVDDRTQARACQGALALSVPQWRELVHLLNITEPAIRPL